MNGCTETDAAEEGLLVPRPDFHFVSGILIAAAAAAAAVGMLVNECQFIAGRRGNSRLEFGMAFHRREDSDCTLLTGWIGWEEEVLEKGATRVGINISCRSLQCQ